MNTAPGSSGYGGIGIVGRDGAAFTLEMLGCEIVGNAVSSGHTGGSQGRYYAYMGGFGVSGGPGTVTIRNCKIVGNSAIQSLCCGIWNESYAYGGGVGLQDAKVTMVNCIVANNYSSASSWNAGCGICVYSGVMDIVNSTVVNNSGAGAGLYVNSGSCTITNSIFYYNSANQTQIYPDNVKMSYSCVQGGYVGYGNIQKSPSLCPETFSLIVGSPCIDAGNPALEYRDGCTSTEECSPLARGSSRNDMGAYGGPWVCGWTDPSPEPKIRIQPEGGVVLEGDPAAMGVIATGDTPLTNRWYKGTAMFPGEKGSVLHFSSVQLSDSSIGADQTNAYWVEVSNAKGKASSQPVWLLVSELGVSASLEQGQVWLTIRRNKAIARCEIRVSETALGPWATIATVNVSNFVTRWQVPDAPGGSARFYYAIPKL